MQVDLIIYDNCGDQLKLLFVAPDVFRHVQGLLLNVGEPTEEQSKALMQIAHYRSDQPAEDYDLTEQEAAYMASCVKAYVADAHTAEVIAVPDRFDVQHIIACGWAS